MEIRLYNVLTKTKETFNPITKGQVNIYTCGPTVYWHQHIGNLRQYTFADILRRVIEYNGLKVKHIINITDVGHLTSDADEGEDKMEEAARKEGKTAQDIAKYYFDLFAQDRQDMNLLEPTKWTKATDHIKEQIAMIKTLEEKEYTYQTSDGIYFDTSRFPNYGKLSNKKVEKIKAGARVSLGEKKNTTDFALWKFSKPEDKRQQEWESPWGTGFPGWHIECSAMSSKYLGKQFDIHTGGEDHLHIHHENEIAQSECAFDVSPWVNVWMHGAFLTIPEGKMSKSEGTIETLSELQKQGITPMQFKYFTYTAHYRKPLTWSKDAIMTAQQSYNRMKEIIKKLDEQGSNEGVNEGYLEQFHERINDDLDIPGAIAVLWKMLRDTKAKGKTSTIKEMEKVFALDLLKQETVDIPSDIKELAEARQKARENKDFEKSDKLRKELTEKGWNVKDTGKGYELEKR